MSQRSHEEDSIHSIEEDLEKMTLAHSLAAQQQKNGDDSKTPLDSESVLRNPEDRKATKDDPKDKNASTTVVHSRLRPDLDQPMSSTPSDETCSPLPSTVWVITQTRVVFSALRTLCLCTSFSTSKAVLYRLRDEFSSRPSLHISERTKRVLRGYYVVHDQSDSEEEENGIGFDVLMNETEGVLYHVNASRAKGNKRQGNIANNKVFREGFTEVTVENIQRVLRG